jgi:hypothetical protein
MAKMAISSLGTNIQGEDLYSAGTLLAAMEQFTISPSFLRDNMFSISEVVETDAVVIDYYKSGNLLAPHVSFHAKGSTVKRNKMKSSTFKPPKIAPILALTADDLFYRMPGQMTVTREAELLARDIEELDEKITRTEEWLCSQCLEKGSIDIRDYDSNRIIATLDYEPRVPTVVGTPWTDPVNSKPLDDLKACIRAVSSNANLVADFIVFGSTAASLWENSEQVLTAYNRLFLQQGLITPKMIDWGVTTLGTFRGIPLYIYEATFEDRNGNAMYYLDPETVLVACSQNKGRLAFAGIAQVNDSETNLTVIAGKRVPLIWFPEDSDVRKLRLASRPCPISPDPSNWTIMKVV